MTANKIACEDDIVQGYFARLAEGYGGALGLGDDCAVITPPQETDLVVTTDPLREGVHFFSDDAPADIAWKALAVNVSDLAAKAAEPFGYVMALSFPEAPEAKWLQGFSDGLQEAQHAFGMHLIGGDTDRAPGPLTISITAFGWVPRGQMVLRGTARPGDLLFVSGTLGDSALGLLLRKHDEPVRSWMIADSERHFLLDRYLRPQPVLALRDALREHASAAMDLSDGLLKDAGRMCHASSVGVCLRFANLPLSAAAAGVIARDPGHRKAIVAAGDDYEILAAVSPDGADAFQAMAKDAALAVTQIGEVTTGDDVALIGPDGAPMQLDATGWDHF